MGACSAKEKLDQDPKQIKKPEKQENPNGGQLQGGQNIVSKDLIFQGQGQQIQSDYRIMQKKLGEGASGDVRIAVNNHTGLICAVKIQKKLNNKDERTDLLNEVQILTSVDHPNIIKIYGFYEDPKCFYIVSDLCEGGELFDRILKEESFTEKKACELMVQILKAINYLHSKNIVHRDMKPENILFENQTTDQIKIIDFGGSQIFDPKQKLTKRLGTPYYIAPEVLNLNYNNKCDIWSVGVIFYILLSGLPPFNGDSDEVIFENIKKGKFDFPSDQWSNISSEAKELIKCMLNLDVSKRYDAEQCLNHKWIKNTEVKNELNEVVLKGALSNMKGFRQQQVLQQGIMIFVINNLTTKEEKKALEDAFSALDLNSDGKLSKDELIQGYRKTMNAIQAEEEVNRIMEQVDLDKSGFLEYSEFVMATVNKKKAFSVERLENAFNMFDKDRSGKISLDEVKNMFGRTKKINEKIWDDFMKENDENQDGEISLEEFKALMLKIVT